MRTEKVFSSKEFFIKVEGLLFGENCLRPETVPLKMIKNILPDK